jgi:hypothetical protein
MDIDFLVIKDLQQCEPALSEIETAARSSLLVQSRLEHVPRFEVASPESKTHAVIEPHSVERQFKKSFSVHAFGCDVRFGYLNDPADAALERENAGDNADGLSEF